MTIHFINIIELTETLQAVKSPKEILKHGNGFMFISKVNSESKSEGARNLRPGGGKGNKVINNV